ncbi:late blight resistance protein R1-A-like isoform X2 [Andrographis paniculata]|nr:late blight resistance protein R1-A-like isoform X2 [Andrographis paniculata]
MIRVKLCNKLKLHQDLQSVLKEVQAIVEQVKIIVKSSKGGKDLILTHSFRSSSTSSNVSAIGLEEDLDKIRKKLYRGSSQLSIIPIIGMGGIGKTTLARYAYDDSLATTTTSRHFDVRAWVTISKGYGVKKIISRIFDSIKQSKVEIHDKMDEEEMVVNLYKFLKDRRYLIVMDDVWETSGWDYYYDLIRAFPDDGNGSRVVITSRQEASFFGPSTRPHHMKLMDEVQSLNLLKDRVFGKEDCPPELEEIGVFIVRKCEGLPLAIVVIAGILSKADPMQETWEDVADNIDGAMNMNDDEDFARILSLSYTRLPHHLRPCFLYMASFPENYEIRVSKLFKLWIAEGFLESNDPDKAAKDCLDDLIKRSLVLVVKKSLNGSIKSVKIHDLLRDLCIKIAQDEKFLQVVNNKHPEDVSNLRRVSACSYISDTFWRSTEKSSIRTVLLPLPSMNLIFSNSFHLLQILDANIVHLQYFPIEIGHLFLLKHLALLTSDFENKVGVIEYLSDLKKLETLILMSQSRLRRRDLYLLPLATWRMPRLRHLILFDMCLADPGAPKLTIFKSLETLSRVSSFICSEWAVKLVPNLKKLKIFYQSGDIAKTGWSEYMLTNLFLLSSLEKLNLHVEGPTSDTFPLQKSDISFPASLKELTLTSCRLPWHDLSVVGSLPKLQLLKLRDNACCGQRWTTNEGEFSQLKVLVIERSDLREWVVDEPSHFRRLESLYLSFCTALEKIPTSIGDINTLGLIEVQSCKPSAVESANSIREEQRGYGNYQLLVRIFQPDPDPRGLRKRKEAVERRSVFRQNKRWLE